MYDNTIFFYRLNDKGSIESDLKLIKSTYVTKIQKILDKKVVWCIFWAQKKPHI